MKKRGTALIVLAAVVIFGTVFGSWRSLRGLRRDCAEAFYVGTDGSGYGIQTNLDLRVEYARNLCKIAGDYDAAEETEAVQEACRALETAEDPDDKYEENLALTEAVNTLDRQLQSLSLSTEDEDYRQELTADLRSYEMRIDKLATDYNAGARSFNEDILGSFPAAIFGALTDVEELEVFG